MNWKEVYIQVLVKEFLRVFYKNMEKTKSQDLVITTHESRY